MNLLHDFANQATRRTFLGATAGALGSTALSTLLNNVALATSQRAGASSPPTGAADGPARLLPHFTPKAKRVLCLFQSEGFSHVDLFDNKPSLAQNHAKDLPPSVKGTQRI